MGNICRDLHLLLDTLDIQLTKLGKNVAHVSKPFILEALKQGYFVTHHKNYFDDSPAPPPPPQPTHKLLSSCYNGHQDYITEPIQLIMFHFVSCMFPFVAVVKMFLFSSGGDGFLIFANRYDIRHLAFDLSYYVELVPDQKGAVALDFDFNSGYIFWTDVIEEEIRRAKMEENPKVEVIAKINVDPPDGIAVDWINKKLYWTDTGNDMIEVQILWQIIYRTKVHTIALMLLDCL